MVRQFADPYAFWRELVQNSIDAGATRLEVTLARAGDSLVRSALSDDGCGMTPEVVEGNLLTLFSSTKEGDEEKVGKYGVGFVSVFALDPDRIVVETWRDGHAYRLVLARDHSYELSEIEPRPASGTVVALQSTLDLEAFRRHRDATRTALSRWCRHARVPITLTVTDDDGIGEVERERIDVPFELPALVSLRYEADGEVYVVGAGTRPGARPCLEASEHFSGFYKRGLTLYESDSELYPGIEGVRFKVESPKLSHTLSRDNVRRDDELTRVLREVARLSAGPLRARLVEELATSAGAALAGEQASYLVLLAASSLAAFGLSEDEVSFALTDPIDGRAALTVRDIEAATPWRQPVLTAPASDPLTAALAARGRPVVWVPTRDVERRLESFFDARSLINPRSCRKAHDAFVLLEPLEELTERDGELCQAVAAALSDTTLAAKRVRLARVHGGLGGRSALPVTPGEELVEVADIKKRARDVDGAELWLDAGASPIVVARAKNDKQRVAAAQLLARLLLLEAHGALRERDADALLEAALRELS